MKGVFKAVKKNGEEYFRASITYRGKHISLGSFPEETEASGSYQEARDLLDGSEGLEHIPEQGFLPFEKRVSLVNFRENGIYFANPIYLRKHFFRYYLDKDEFLLFDIDDLFYYSSHKISLRGGHLFVADYGSQISLRNRYGIMPFAVKNRDFRFLNGDDHDYRLSNIEIINRFRGVRKIQPSLFNSVIHIRGDFVIGTYETELEAAIAYNKAADILKKAGCRKNFPQNEPDVSPKTYSEIYIRIPVSPKILNLSFPHRSS